MQIDTSKLTANWKTTASGFLFLLMALQHSVNFDPAGHLAMTQKDWFTVLIGLFAAFVGYISKDAGEQRAIPPGGSEPEMMPSHETPNDPNATPVVDPK